MIVVRVKQEHIDGGVKRDPCNCPISLALKDSMDIIRVHVTDYGIIVGGHSYYTPDNAREFIKKFDGDELVKPFEFTLTD